MFSFNLHENEKLISLIRQTEWVLFFPAALVLVLLYFPVAFLLQYELLAQYRLELFIWTILVALYGVHTYFLWLLNSYLITNERVIRVSYPRVFKKEVTERLFSHVSTVSYRTTGIFSSLYRFGNVEIQSPGINEIFILERVSEPEKIKDTLWHAQTEARMVIDTQKIPTQTIPETGAGDIKEHRTDSTFVNFKIPETSAKTQRKTIRPEQAQREVEKNSVATQKQAKIRKIV